MSNNGSMYNHTSYQKHIRWSHVILCILVISTFFIILSNVMNKNYKQNITDQNSLADQNSNNSSSVAETPDNTESTNQAQETNNTESANQVVENNNTEQKESKSAKTNQSVTKNFAELTDEQYNNIIHIYSQDTEKTVYLTFDDGPTKNITPLILDLLKKENIKATFFVLGTNVENYPELVQRIYNEGHYIANHGYSHKYSEIYVSTDTILNDYTRCEQALKKALNNENFLTRVYRYPGGSSGGKYNDIKLEGRKVLKDNHVAYLDWNALTYDAEGTPTRESILENLEATVGDKNVVVLLMHDSSSKILTYDTLPDVISFLRNKGYSFKTLYDVLE